MARERRSGGDRRTTHRHQGDLAAVEVYGWTILAHPLFLDAIERLVAAVESEQEADSGARPRANANLLAHLLDLAFDKIPSNPANPEYRHGGTLPNGRNWFRAKTGNGRYRLFFRYLSTAKVIALAWVSDEESLRTYGSRTDAYAVFAGMLEDGNPPDDWDALVADAATPAARRRLQRLVEKWGVD